MLEYPTFRHLRLENEDGITVVTLPGIPVVDEVPEYSLFSELSDMFVPLSRDPAVSAVVVTGTGDRVLHRQAPETNKLITQAPLLTRAGTMHRAQQLINSIVTFPKPFVCAANGPGAEHFLYADAIVASRNATFGDDHHVVDGVAAGDGNTLIWPFLVGMAKARQTLFWNRRFSADEAFEIGFVVEVVDEGAVREAGVRWARKLADLPQMSFMATKLALNNWFRFAGLVTMDLATGYQAAGMADPKWVEEHT